ncbi:dUTP diphosphatase [Blattabacterium cuenoti]|uniref:dUTP diphosphatase n=1 Tax=Blattabacterium cuenoti TaxID=1653831 RepID=UPI00163CE383|nr:dUTP diphosphatase [Blattabacterium cuenoti]
MHKKIYQSTLIANIKKSIFISFLGRKLISTGVLIKKSKDTRCSFFLRKKFIESICVIHLTKNKKHTSYEEIKIIIINILYKNIMIVPGEKLVILNIFKNIRKIKWKKCSDLSLSVRGSNSFGSTGI